MKTVSDDQKKEVIKEILTEKYGGGITELELRSVLKHLFYKKEVSRTFLYDKNVINLRSLLKSNAFIAGRFDSSVGRAQD